MNARQYTEFNIFITLVISFLSKII
jgi:hypothetical protein